VKALLSYKGEPKMSDHISIRDVDKLKGLQNYYVWSFKLRTILRSKGVWAFSEEVTTPANFPATIDGKQYTEM
jgi:hypothetical protein